MSETTALAVLPLLADVALIFLCRRIAGRWLSALVLVASLWTVYFPLRLTVIVTSPRDPSFHPEIANATQGDLRWAASIAVGGLLSLTVGAAAFRRRGLGKSQPDVSLGRPELVSLCLIGAVLSAAALFVIHSGLIAAIAPLYLFGLGALGWIEAQDRLRPSTFGLVVLSSLIGVLSGFKEGAVLPIAAWALGRASGRIRPIRARSVLLISVIALSAYLGIAGERIAHAYQEKTSFAPAIVHAAFFDDLATATPGGRSKSIGASISNIFDGLSSRFNGTDSLLVIHADVPSRTPFVHGASIFQPMISVIPGMKRYVRSDFRALSLGRYFSQNFYSLNPTTDPSSQAITVPGDLYLNFGLVGVYVGCALLGAALIVFDRRWPPNTAVGAGVMGYVGTAILGIERNVGYQIITVGLRVAAVALLIQLLAPPRRRPSGQSDDNSPSLGERG